MSLFTDLQSAGLPVVSATDGAQATFSRSLTDAESEIYYNLLDPTRQQRLLDIVTERTDLKAQALTAIARLQQIQAAGTIPFSQAGFNQLVAAVKDEALYLERIMKVLARLI